MMTRGSFDAQSPGESDPFTDSPGPSAMRLSGGLVAMLVGGALLLAGLVLHIGEKAGRLLIFPMAGRLTMLLGVGVLGVGVALAGRRAAIGLCVVAVIGGIVAYGIGLAYVEQLGTRLVQAFGLLTALVGLIVLLATYGMNRATGPGEAGGGQQT
jgi:hypothetical protein